MKIKILHLVNVSLLPKYTWEIIVFVDESVETSKSISPSPSKSDGAIPTMFSLVKKNYNFDCRWHHKILQNFTKVKSITKSMKFMQK